MPLPIAMKSSSVLILVDLSSSGLTSLGSSITSIAKELRAIKAIAYSKEVNYRNGRRARLKNFLVRRIATKIKETSAIEKLSCRCRTN